MEFPSKQAFRDWLRCVHPHQVIARDWHCTNCPLALFLGHAGAPRPYVRPDLCDAESNWQSDWGNWAMGNGHPLPQWANNFGLRIDFDAALQDQERFITAEDCLRILGEVWHENNKTPPLNGKKTHPLSQHAIDELRSLLNSPRPRQEINPGVINRFMREDLIELVDLPSPYKTHKGRNITHAQITEAGRTVLRGMP